MVNPALLSPDPLHGLLNGDVVPQVPTQPQLPQQPPVQQLTGDCPNN